MEVPPNYGNPDRDIEQALIALKKGSQLIKYSRKGKPKLCSFRLSNDETKLIWLSHKKERNLELTSIIRILPGQRTAVFKRYPRPEKDYLSFSLLYNSGGRSLDLICKNQAEVEAWFTSLSTLISTGHRRRARDDGQSDGAPFSDELDSFHSGQSYGATIETSSAISRLNTKAAFEDTHVRGEPSLSFRKSDVGTGHANMHPRTSNGDISRLSVSSAPSCSSQGSGHDEIESLGDVYVWGELWSDGITPDGRGDSARSKVDVLIPRPLESNVVLDVHQIACGSRNMALVTRQGEVFTWGEESGGRLGHGVSIDVSRPRIVESLAPSNIDSVACGESHTCAINTGGDLFTWGDGAHGTGLLGHGGDVSHWIPKRVSGPLEGLQVLSVACGAWHSALTTSNGKIYTFGDGTFGALGHGDRQSAGCPREIEGLSGLRAVKVACGVWHTAAIVEVMGLTVGTNAVSRKLFTWGDGDKYRLGQGDKEARLVPTCVPSLIDYSFHQLACGDSLTVALTTSGHVFTMGSSAHGQLGNPQSDGKLPCLVQDRLVGELVEEIACGSHHVVVLTSRSEVYSWGRGGNGRLGHGDRDDRKTPAAVEALKDRHVRSISCGSNFTACICVHKWVSGADQSVCTACRLAFGFTKKRHNCYNCGLVHCHGCSSKKALKAALAPTPGKPHRVCDSCHSKLKAAETGMSSAASRKSVGSRQSIDSRDSRFDRGEIRYSSRLLLAPTQELGSHHHHHYHHHDVIRYGKNEHRSPLPQVSPPSHMAFTSSMSLIQTALKPVMTPPPPAASSRFVTPYTWRPSPSQSAAPEFSGSMVETMKKTNEHLDREVLKLQGQVKSMKQKLEQQGSVAQMALKKAEEASSIAADEHAKFSAAVELLRTFQAQMNDMEERLPSDLVDNFRAMLASSESYLRNSKSGTLASSSALGNHRGDDLECTAGGIAQEDGKPAAVNYMKEASDDHGSMENGSRSPRTSTNSHGEVQLTEQFEPGVYVTLAQLRDGTKVFKRVRFSKRRFAEQQAEEWWRENQGRVLKKYNYPGHNRSYSTSHAFSTANSEASAAASSSHAG